MVAFGQKRKNKAVQGICIQLYWKAGNFMPSPDVSKPQKSNKGTAVQREVYVYALTNSKDAESIEGQFYSNIKTKLIAKAKTDKKGKAWIKLPVGYYSVFVKEEKGLYANSFDDAMNINAVEVKAKKWTNSEMIINYMAVY